MHFLSCKEYIILCMAVCALVNRSSRNVAAAFVAPSVVRWSWWRRSGFECAGQRRQCSVGRCCPSLAEPAEWCGETGGRGAAGVRQGRSSTSEDRWLIGWIGWHVASEMRSDVRLPWLIATHSPHHTGINEKSWTEIPLFWNRKITLYCKLVALFLKDFTGES